MFSSLPTTESAVNTGHGFSAIKRPDPPGGLLLAGAARNTLNRRGAKSNTQAREGSTMPRTKKPVVEKAEPQTGEQPQVSKSQAVRDYLKQNRGALPVAVSEALIPATMAHESQRACS